MKQNLLLFYLSFTSSLFCATEKEKQVTLVQKTNNVFLESVSVVIGSLQPCKLHNFETAKCINTTCLITLKNGPHQLCIIPDIFKECTEKYDMMREHSLKTWFNLINTPHQGHFNLILDYEGLRDMQENE